MTQDEIIRMARKCGDWNGQTAEFNDVGLKHFAALVAAHERNRLAWTQEHWTQYEHTIAAAEREACAKVCAEGWKKGIGAKYQGDVFAEAIRARGDK